MPLKGVRVLELAGLAPAPFCGMLLADFGATVTKIDSMNRMNVEVLGAGKQSIRLDLKHDKGKEVFRRLCAASDVLIEPFRAGTMERLGLGPDDIMALNPRLIYARLTGFGQSGSWARSAGHDINYVALSGVLSLLGRADQPPTPPLNLLADFAGGGVSCALGVLLALVERARSGRGQVVDAAMTEGVAYLASWVSRSRGALPLWDAERGHNHLDSGAHFYDTYETKDGRHMAVGAVEPQFYAELLEKLGLDEALVPQYGDWPAARRVLAERFAQRTLAEWCAVFDGSDACVTPVLTLEEAASHPHNVARGVFARRGPGPGPGPGAAPARWSRSPRPSSPARRACPARPPLTPRACTSPAGTRAGSCASSATRRLRCSGCSTRASPGRPTSFEPSCRSLSNGGPFGYLWKWEQNITVLKEFGLIQMLEILSF